MAAARLKLADCTRVVLRNGLRLIGVDAPDMAAITRSKDFLLSGAVDYEFRTTVVKGLHTEESLVEAAK